LTSRSSSSWTVVTAKSCRVGWFSPGHCCFFTMLLGEGFAVEEALPNSILTHVSSADRAPHLLVGPGSLKAEGFQAGFDKLRIGIAVSFDG
jgi:hypothetical protein